MSLVTATDGPSVLGVYLGHDLGACLLRNGEITVCIEEERLNRFKHGRPNSVAGLWPQFGGKFGYFPWASVCYCLEAGGLAIDDLDLIVVGDALWAAAATSTIRSLIPIKDKDKVVFVTEPCGAVHHYHHALSTFFGSPFESAAVLVVDGDGNSNEDGYEAETGYVFSNRSGEHRLVFKNRYRDSSVPRSGIGWMYEQVTLLLGFANASIFLADPGKTMGLSSYGRPRPELEARWIGHQGFRLDFSGFRRWLQETGYDRRLLSYTGGLATTQDGGEPSQYAKDVAFKVQKELEDTMLRLATEMHRETGAENLCLAGGVALNSVANALIATRGPFTRVFIPPCAYDGGQALGLAYHGHLMLSDHSPYSPHTVRSVRQPHFCGRAIAPLTHAYCGRSYDASEIRDLLTGAGLDFTELSCDRSLAERAASDLAAGSVLGWMQGGSEIGPRALGHRSILANPCGPHIKDHLNHNVKFRESFRPFAPSVLAERADEVFELDGESPYMLLIAPVREAWRDRVPAIVHIDQTARVQTVNAAVEPRYHGLIAAFHRRTGVPLILNTSFNVQSMPLVESPYDALHCFLCTDLDVLYMDRFRVERPGAERLYPVKARGWDFTVSRAVARGQLTLVGRRHDRSRQVEVRMSEPALACFDGLDGETSIDAAYRKAFAPELANRGLRDVIEAIQLLARHGALKLRAGDVTFGLPEPDTHWWQVATPRA